MPRPRLLICGLALAVVTAGCSTGSAKPQANDLEPITPPTTTAPPAAVPVVEKPIPTATPTTASPKPKPKPTYDVKAVQTQLTSLGYYVGAIDGEPGARMRSAVMAFQKVQGISADGGIGKVTLAALKAPKKPVLRGSGGGTRVEVDLNKQVLYIVKDSKVTRILPVSSGNGERYRTKNGNLARALSPVGYYKIQRRIVGERKADLGVLYDPQYFYRGWAIHGSNSVPPYPASHGCIRVTRWDAKWLLNQINNGVSLYIYGGRHTFTAGSSAPGTDAPSGDTEAPKPTASPTPTRKPTPSPTASPTPSPTPSATPTSPITTP